jgi:regulatory protein
MAEVTALRAERPGVVAVELDGAPWRTIPADVVIGTGLAVGAVLDRADLRRLRAALRRSEALGRATAIVARRSVSTHALDERLAAAGVAAPERNEAIATLSRAGYLDDERLAAARAATLAGRGAGDDAIRADLERRGVGRADVERALASLPPEAERAREILAERGRTAATALRLARKGFTAETLEAFFQDSVAPDG